MSKSRETAHTEGEEDGDNDAPGKISPGGGSLGYLGGRIRSLSKLKNTPKALISGQKSNLILINADFFH